MPVAGTRLLAALALLGWHIATPAAPCGCAQFTLDAGDLAADVATTVPKTAAGAPALSANARAVRDFVLFSHRRIGADLIRAEGPYLHTLSGLFPHCLDDARKLAWLRQLLASTSDTSVFAERIARHYDQAGVCEAPSR